MYATINQIYKFQIYKSFLFMSVYDRITQIEHFE